MARQKLNLELNLAGLKRPARKSSRYILTEDHLPGIEIKFGLIEPDFPMFLKLSDITNAKVSFYTTAIKLDPDQPAEMPPMPFIDGAEVSRDTNFIACACTLFCFQDVEWAEREYSVEELMMLLTTFESSFVQLVAIANQLVTKFEALMSNPTLAVTGPQ